MRCASAGGVALSYKPFDVLSKICAAAEGCSQGEGAERRGTFQRGGRARRAELSQQDRSGSSGPRPGCIPCLQEFCHAAGNGRAGDPDNAAGVALMERLALSNRDPEAEEQQCTSQEAQALHDLVPASEQLFGPGRVERAQGPSAPAANELPFSAPGIVTGMPPVSESGLMRTLALAPSGLSPATSRAARPASTGTLHVAPSLGRTVDRMGNAGNSGEEADHPGAGKGGGAAGCPSRGG